jgi:hypothetical protein
MFTVLQRYVTGDESLYLTPRVQYAPKDGGPNRIGDVLWIERTDGSLQEICDVMNPSGKTVARYHWPHGDIAGSDSPKVQGSVVA